jgi:hypothetical protein
MSDKEEDLNDMNGFKPLVGIPSKHCGSMGQTNARISNDRAFNNPNVPGEVKGSDQPVIDRDISRDQSGKGMHNARGDPNNDLARVAAGLQA